MGFGGADPGDVHRLVLHGERDAREHHAVHQAHPDATGPSRGEHAQPRAPQMRRAARPAAEHIARAWRRRSSRTAPRGAAATSAGRTPAQRWRPSPPCSAARANKYYAAARAKPSALLGTLDLVAMHSVLADEVHHRERVSRGDPQHPVLARRPPPIPSVDRASCSTNWLPSLSCHAEEPT